MRTLLTIYPGGSSVGLLPLNEVCEDGASDDTALSGGAVVAVSVPGGSALGAVCFASADAAIVSASSS